MPNRRFGVQKESPDVETPGLLVKALISSYFEIRFLLMCFTKITSGFNMNIPHYGYFYHDFDCFFISSCTNNIRDSMCAGERSKDSPAALYSSGRVLVPPRLRA